MSSGYIRGASARTQSTSTSSIPPGAVVHNAKASRVYVFGNADVYEDEVNGEAEIEMSEIRSRRGNASRSPTRKPEEPLVFEREITEGDTLLSIALQYSCPVAELKRINNMIRDQEFYGRRMIKVPIMRYGYLTEILELEKQNEQKRAARRAARPSLERVDSEEELHTDSTADFSDPDTQRKVIRHLSIRDHLSQQGRETQKFLDSMDKDLERIRNSSRSNRSSLDEVVEVLTHKNFQPLQRKPSHLNGADCGISWWRLLLVCAVILVVGIVALLLYVYHHRGDS